jgi:hypothetical protein
MRQILQGCHSNLFIARRSNSSPSRILRYHILDNLVALLGCLENMPHIRWDAFERSLKSFRLVLLLNPNCGDICHFADENQFYPAFVSAVSMIGVSTG